MIILVLSSWVLVLLVFVFLLCNFSERGRPLGVGSGLFIYYYHLSFKAQQWYLLDPDTSKVELMEETAWFKRRRFLVEKCKDANTVGILVCKLAGDQTKDIIARMKQLCRVNGKKSYIVSVGKPNVAKLANFPEVYI